MIWSWLGRVPPANTRPELVSSYDLLPTLCELTGAPLPEGRNLCGRSYVSAGVRPEAAEEGAMAQPGVRPIPEYGDGAGYAI